MTSEPRKVEDGGPANPVTTRLHGGTENFVNTGITMRDYFAAAALPGLMHYYANQSAVLMSQIHGELSGECYRIADAMLAARKPSEVNS